MKQPKALRLAKLADYWSGIYPHGIDTAIELRRLHEVNKELLDVLQMILRKYIGDDNEVIRNAKEAIKKAGGAA